jgi:hypothetical protein
LKVIGHGNPDSNLESSCISLEEKACMQQPICTVTKKVIICAGFPFSKSKTYNKVQKNPEKQRGHGEEYPKNFGFVFTTLHYV